MQSTGGSNIKLSIIAGVIIIHVIKVCYQARTRYTLVFY